jgi:DNA-binding MarR family transcriptional regulator
MNNLSYSRSALTEAIPIQIREVMEACSQLGPEPWLDLDLTMKQLKVLLVLHALGAARPSVIAAHIGASAANATGVLDRLVAQGFIERQPDAADRRALLVRLTESGRATVSQLYLAGQERLTRALAELSDDDLGALHQGVSALVEATRNLMPAVSSILSPLAASAKSRR